MAASTFHSRHKSSIFRIIYVIVHIMLVWLFKPQRIGSVLVLRGSALRRKRMGASPAVSLNTQVFLHAMLHFIRVHEHDGISSIIVEPVFCGWMSGLFTIVATVWLWQVHLLLAILEILNDVNFGDFCVPAWCYWLQNTFFFYCLALLSQLEFYPSLQSSVLWYFPQSFAC